MLHGTLSCVAAWLGEDVQYVTGWNSASTSWLSWLLSSTTRLFALSLGIAVSSDKSPFLNQQLLLDFSTWNGRLWIGLPVPPVINTKELMLVALALGKEFRNTHLLFSARPSSSVSFDVSDLC